MSIEDAIQNAVGRASRTLRQVGWFEVVETRGHVEDGEESGADPLDSSMSLARLRRSDPPLCDFHRASD